MAGLLRMKIKGRKLAEKSDYHNFHTNIIVKTLFFGIDATLTMASKFLLPNEGVNENHKPVMYIISL